MLSEGSGKSNVKDEARKEDRINEPGKYRKKGWQEKMNATEQSKNLDKYLADEIEVAKRYMAIENERKRKTNGISKSLIMDWCLQCLFICESNAA